MQRLFLDASPALGQRAMAATLAASVLDLVEHSANGRNPGKRTATGETTVFAGGLNFAHGSRLDDAGGRVFVESKQAAYRSGASR